MTRLRNRSVDEADFAEIDEIIARCIGYPDNKFLAAYYKNIGLHTEQAPADWRIQVLSLKLSLQSLILNFSKNQLSS